MRNKFVTPVAVLASVLAVAIAGCGSSSSTSSSAAGASSTSTPTTSASASDTGMSTSSAMSSSHTSGAAETMSAHNLVAVAAGSPQFSTLVSLLKKAGLVSALQGPGPYTVFAPTNQAFVAVSKDDPALFAKVTHSKALLTEVLEYHVVKGRLRAGEIEMRHYLTTLLGKRLTVKVVDGKVHLQSAEVVNANIAASNGIIHAINGVLVPPASTSPAGP